MKLRVSYEKLTLCSENKEVKFMGMPCEVNSVLKLKPSQGYPESLELSKQYQGSKEDYRIIPVDVPIPLVNEHWVAYADVIIEKLVWENRQTTVLFRIDRIYPVPFIVKET